MTVKSRARQNLDDRLKDIDQLLNAHTAITKFNNAQQAANQASSELAKIGEVISALVTSPGKGRPKEVDAINRAAFVLSIAHFQGFIDELHSEIGHIVLKDKTTNPPANSKLSRAGRSQPEVNGKKQKFAGIGIYELMDKINWQKCDSKTVKSRLTGYIETRNKIAHGSKEAITKNKVIQLKEYIELLARKIEEQVFKKIDGCDFNWRSQQ